MRRPGCGDRQAGILLVASVSTESGVVIGIRNFSISARGAWAVCSLCSFTFDVCDILMGPELFSRVLAHITVGEHQRSERGIIKRPGAELKRVGTKREVTGEALTSPPWEVWTPGRCPHPSWSHEATKHTPL